MLRTGSALGHMPGAQRPPAAGDHVVAWVRREMGFTASLVSTLVVLAFGRALFSHLTLPWVLGLLFGWLFGVILLAAFGVVRHAEFLAHVFGEPYGTLILTISAVCIEVIMITTMMLHGDPDPTMARDTIYSTLMIIINGLIGLAMLLGGAKYGEQQYNLKSSGAFFSMILALVGLGLLVPSIVPPASRGRYGIFLTVSSVLLYAIFLRIQIKEHRYFFVYRGNEDRVGGAHHSEVDRAGWLYHAILLAATLVTIGYLAESLAIVIDDGSDRLGVPDQVGALAVALLILAPEGLTAIRAGLRNDMQRVVNISLGSALSTISLTIPAVLIFGMILRREVILGLTGIQATMLALSLFVGMNSYRSGETNLLQGAIHFVLFASFVVLMFF